MGNATVQKRHLGWKIWSPVFTLLSVALLGDSLVKDGLHFEFCRNFLSTLTGTFGLFFYAFDREGIPEKVWRIVFWYLVVDVVYDLAHGIQTFGALKAVLGYPIELLILFPMFLALYRMAWTQGRKG